MAGRGDYFEQPIDGIEVFDADGKPKKLKLKPKKLKPRKPKP